MNPLSKPLRVLRRAVLVLIGISAAVFLWWYEVTPRTAEDAMTAFYAQKNDGVTEDQLTDPLVLAGDQVVPVVVREVARADMPLRRYAITFLGNAQSAEAVPVLRRIVEDSTELDLFRGDALEALWMIRVSGREELARSFAGRDDFLGQTAGRLLAGYKPQRRTYWQALRHRHE